MSNLTDKIEAEHQLTTESGYWDRWAGCTCGVRYGFETRDREHRDHEFDMAEQAVRAQIAADLRAEANEATLIELADRYAGYYQGRRSGLETAARIAEGQYAVQLRTR